MLLNASSLGAVFNDENVEYVSYEITVNASCELQRYQQTWSLHGWERLCHMGIYTSFTAMSCILVINRSASYKIEFDKSMCLISNLVCFVSVKGSLVGVLMTGKIDVGSSNGCHTGLLNSLAQLVLL